MQAASLPPSAGWQWVYLGFQLFRQQPFPMFTWALSIGLLVLVASMLVPVGPVVFVTLMPAITVMTLNACRDIEAGKVVQPLLLWRLLGHPEGKRLLGVGAVYVLAILVAGFAAFLPFMSSIRAAASDAVDPTSALGLLEAVRTPLLLFGLLYLVIAALFWHAPVLVAWHGLDLRKALFFSGVACWRNKGAFLVYGLAWAVLVALLEMAAALLQGIGLSSNVVSLIQMPFSFVLAAVLYCSFYPTYTTVFGRPGMSTSQSWHEQR